MNGKIKILIVEDEFILTLELKTGLETLGHDVCEPVASGTEALRLLNRGRPDLAVIDVNLVGAMSGLELASKLKEEYGVPFLFITGIADERMQARMKELGPLAILIKPIHAFDIEAVIKGHPELGAG